MNKAFEKIIEKLEERTSFLSDCTKYGNKDEKQQNKSYSTMMMYEVADLVDDLIDIVKQEAEQFVPDTNVGNNGWIPFVHREMTEDEKESFGDFNFMLDCQLPDEDEEILVTYKLKDELYVDVDTFMRDGSECYLDSGRDFVTEAVAWMKKPQPYQPKGE